MMFPAIAWRELAVRARQQRLFVQRAGLAAVGVAVVVVFLVMSDLLQSRRGLGEFLFKFMGWTCMILGGLEGLRQTVDALSVEKREGTLGLLLLTQVNSLDVVLGKWVVHALAAFYHLLAIFPALAIPLVLGGVTAGEFGRLLLCVGNGLFVGLALGMLVSAWGREENEVWGAGVVWLGLLMAAPLLAGGGLAVRPGAAVGELGAGLSPLRAWQHAPASVYAVAPQFFWQSLAVSHLAGWLLLVASAWSMGRVWRTMAQGAPPARRSWVQWLLRPVTRSLQGLDQVLWRRAAKQAPGSQVEPFLLNTEPPARLCLALLLGGAAALALVVHSGSGNLKAALCAAGIFYVLHWVVRFWAAAQSGEVLRNLRDSGWLFTFLAAPLPPQELPRALQKSQAPVYRMVYTLLLLMEVAAGVWWAMDSFQNLSVSQWWGTFGVAMLLMVAAAVILWLDLQALHHAALWHSLNGNQPTAAVRRTIFQVLFLPLLVAPLGFLCSGGALPVFMMVKSLMMKAHFEQRFLREFREGMERAQVVAPVSWVEQMAGLLGVKKAPPRLPGLGNGCVACGHDVGQAAYCPMCGYRQPSSEA